MGDTGQCMGDMLNLIDFDLHFLLLFCSCGYIACQLYSVRGSLFQRSDFCHSFRTFPQACIYNTGHAYLASP